MSARPYDLSHRGRGKHGDDNRLWGSGSFGSREAAVRGAYRRLAENAKEHPSQVQQMVYVVSGPGLNVDPAYCRPSRTGTRGTARSTTGRGRSALSSARRTSSRPARPACPTAAAAAADWSTEPGPRSTRPTGPATPARPGS